MKKLIFIFGVFLLPIICNSQLNFNIHVTDSFPSVVKLNTYELSIINKGKNTTYKSKDIQNTIVTACTMGFIGGVSANYFGSRDRTKNLTKAGYAGLMIGAVVIWAVYTQSNR